MSRAFGASGVGASDAIITGVTSSGSDKRSYSIWYYRTGNGGSNNGLLFYKSTSEFAYWENFGGRFAYERCNSSGVRTARWELIPPIGTASTASVWNHFLLTHDQSSGTLTAASPYWNGAIGSVSSIGSGTTAPNANPYYVGNWSGAANVWDGLLAHFAIWDDVILGPGDAQALMAGVHPMSISPANCVCYLPLDGIHSPEPDFTFRNAPGIVTGTKLGALQPGGLSMYIPPISSNNPSLIQAIGSGAPAIGPMVSMIL